MNFNSLNKIFEDKFTISKKLLREEASLKSKKEKSKKKLTESIDRNLTERDWKLTIPGSFRDDMLNAGEEEDFDKVKNILIDMCNYVLEHIDESNFDLDDQEYVIEEFEDFIEELEYVDFEDEDEANYYLNDLYDLLDNTDIFLGLRESLNEDVESISIPDPYDKYFELEDEDQLEEYGWTKGDQIPNYDCHILAMLYPKNDEIDVYPILTDDPDYPVCELAGERLYPVKIERRWKRLIKDESLNEEKSELTKADILNWLAEHDQAYDDAEKFFKGNLTGTSVEDLKAWISDHNQLASDFEGYFNCSLDESLNEEKITGGNMEQEDINLIEPFINFLDELESNYKDVCTGITWNFGRRKSDNKMTAGVDVYLKGDFDNEDSEDYWLKKDEELLDRIRDYLPDYGFKFDDSLGYDSNPWKEHAFGQGYHTQIIEDAEEVVEESFGYKPSFDEWYFQETGVNTSDLTDEQYDELWADEDLMNHYRKFCDGLDESLNEFLTPQEEKPPVYKIYYNPRTSSNAVAKNFAVSTKSKERALSAISDLKKMGCKITRVIKWQEGVGDIPIHNIETLDEDTVKQDGKWVNKGKEGTHGKFKTKKEADAQRKAMFANGYKG